MSGASINTDGWPHVAAALLFDREARLIIYLRDDKPSIPFPDCWDFFGGHVEPGESIEQALVREVREELGITLPAYTHFRDYTCDTGDAWPNVKHIYWSKLDVDAADLTLYEGQRLAAFPLDESRSLRWANVLGAIVADFLDARIDVRRAPACPVV